MSTVIYLHEKNKSSPFFFLNHFFQLLSEAQKNSYSSFQVKIYL